MKHLLLQQIAVTLIAPCLLLFTSVSEAQTIENPGAYMTAIASAQTEMHQKYMAYMSAVAHGRRARRVEKMRMAALESIQNCKYKTTDINIYKGDNSLRKSSIEYIDLCYKVFNEDYKHIVDMEEIAEQSFDEMQAYILLNEKTSEKIQQASDNMFKASEAFAGKYNVTLINSTNELREKMERAGLLNSYNNKVFLVFYKCNWQDAEMMKAMNKKDIKGMEQSRNSLVRYANEGLAGLDSLSTFEGDASLSRACREAVLFYKKIAENDMNSQTDFYLKQEEFEKTKKAFETKSERTKQDVDAYNKAVKEINTYSNNFTQSVNAINNNRAQVLQKWSEAEKAFSDKHMPHYK